MTVCVRCSWISNLLATLYYTNNNNNVLFLGVENDLQSLVLLMKRINTSGAGQNELVDATQRLHKLLGMYVYLNLYIYIYLYRVTRGLLGIP